MPIQWTDNAAANQLLESDPLALLIGLVLDQQVKMEKAFSGPYDLRNRLGHLDPVRIASMDPAKLDQVFRERPAIHRFPGSMARRVQALCKAVVEDYGGDAAAVWSQAADGADLARRIGRLPGFGEMKVKITVAVLAKRFGVQPAGWERYAASWHTVADVDSAESMEQARVVKRAMKEAAQKGNGR
jgi:uncharacterized HhH-GPD family protein